MPSERFFRLPDSKRQVIRDAAIKEFSRVPFEKASINQIIQTADISRGSFYTYFEDKTDVVRWLFEDSFCQMRSVCQDELERTGGDYFAMMDCLFDLFVYKFNEAQDIMNMARNVFSYQENTKAIGIMGFPSPAQAAAEDSPERWVYERVDKSGMRDPSFERFSAMIALGSAALMMAVKQYYEYPDQLDEIRRNYKRAMDVLRIGAYQADVTEPK